ncbi:Mycolipanoate synthase [Microsporum ferrugineum]
MSDNTVMSPSGTCKTFDGKADGYGRAEAINALYIKTLDDALQNNDPIRGIIRATSINFDGRMPTITTPESESQEALVRRAYQRAGIKDISQTGSFECHGTGTVAGDTVEVSVVAKLFEGKGVVKPNVGHGEGASGITSVIKGIMSLEHDTIPPNILFESPNPNIPFKEAKLQVLLDPMPWPENRSKRVSVNSFGVGGANAHAILESAASFCKAKEDSSSAQCDGPQLLTVSAKNTDSLKERIKTVTQYINDELHKLHDLAYTLGVRREHLSHRSFIIAHPNQPVDATGLQSGQDKPPSLTFVFTGQGAQWPVRSMEQNSPLLLKEKREAEIITAFRPVKITDIVDSEWYSFTIMAHDGSDWTKHCQGEVRAGSGNPPKGYKIQSHARAVDVDTCYKVMGRLGFSYGPRFRRFKDISVHPTEGRTSATILGVQERALSRYTLHPATMDHVLQLWPIAIGKASNVSFIL